MGDAVLVVAAITTAAVATATFVSKRWLEMREFASRVYVSPESEDEIQLTIVVKNGGEGPVQYLGVALFSWGKPRMTWRWRRSQADWWTGARVAGRFVPMISPHGETEPIEFPTGQVSRTPHRRISADRH